MKESRSSQDIVAMLERQGLIPAHPENFVRELRRNHERRADYGRQRFVVYTGPKPVGFLTVGSGLAALRDRITLFHQAYGDLGNQVLGFFEYNGTGYLLETYFDAPPAIFLLQRPGHTAKILAALRQTEAAFNANLRPSTPQAAEAELSEFLREVASLPYWTQADRVFLQEIVGPYLHTRLLGGARVQRRVTNGDFLLRNLLVNDHGQVRVVDCEYASDTHLYTEDWLRLTYWDILPDEVKAFAQQQVPDPEPWSVYLSLKQLLYESQGNLPQKAQVDAHHWCREIRRCLASGETQASRSFFWPSDTPATPATQLLAQLFWLSDDGWSDKNSASATVASNRALRLTFEVPAGAVVHALRFDPMNCPGTATIQSFKLWSSAGGDTPLYSAEGADLNRLMASGDALINLSSGVCELVSLGADPQLYLNNITNVGGKGLRLEVTVVYSTDPAGLGVALSQKLPALFKQLSSAAESLGKPDSAEQSIRALENAILLLTQRCTTLQSQMVELEALLGKQAALERKLQATYGQTRALQTMVNERSQQLDLARQSLAGHARTIDRLELLCDKLLLQAEAQSAHAHSLEAERAALQLRILSDLEPQLASARQQVSTLHDALKGELARRRQIQATRSWRWTAWLRHFTPSEKKNRS